MSKENFDSVWLRITEETNIKTFVQLAEIIGKTHQNISAAKKRGTFPPEWAFRVWEVSGVLTEWLMTGIGPKRLPDSEAPSVQKNLQRLFSDLSEYAASVSDSENFGWLENQIEICLPSFKIWREQKKSGAEAPLHEDQVNRRVA